MNKIVTLLLFTFFTSASFAAVCDGDKRLTPSNYPFKYKKTKRALKKTEGESFVQRFNKLESNDSEVCAWNRFLFVDFFIYFDRFHDLKMNKEENLIETLNLRDELYADWLEKNKTAVYSDYAQSKLEGLNFEEFLEKPSEKFGYITKPLKLINKRPKNDEPKQFVFDLLNARSPFNGIFPDKAMKLLEQEQTNRDLKCILTKEESNLRMALSDCFESKDRMLEIVGVLASQRMYLIRDFASFKKQNSSEADYNLYYENAALSSLLYFKLETLAHTYGVHTVYPIDNEELKSPKPYHFYSVAYIANEMKIAGFTNEEIQEAANAYAVKYKKNIKLVGILYNTISGIPLKNGSVGDAKQILTEQKLGIDYTLNLEEN